MAITDEDKDFFCRIVPIYGSSVNTAVDPIVLEHGEYYDGHEDQEVATDIMARRIRTCGKDIRDHLRIHEKIANAFYDLEEKGLNVRNRGNIFVASLEIISLLKWQSELVKRHKEKAKSLF